MMSKANSAGGRDATNTENASHIIGEARPTSNKPPERAFSIEQCIIGLETQAIRTLYWVGLGSCLAEHPLCVPCYPLTHPVGVVVECVNPPVGMYMQTLSEKQLSQ